MYDPKSVALELFASQDGVFVVDGYIKFLKIGACLDQSCELGLGDH